jgi:hypothetical protein
MEQLSEEVRLLTKEICLHFPGVGLEDPGFFK